MSNYNLVLIHLSVISNGGGGGVLHFIAFAVSIV